MKNLILISSFLIPSLSFANIDGVWRGKLNINGKACKETSIEINKSSEALTIVAALDKEGVPDFECGDKVFKYYMELAEVYDVKGSELWKNNFLLGEVSDQKITAKDRFCNDSGCHVVDYIKITKLEDKIIKIWIDFDGAILSGEMHR